MSNEKKNSKVEVKETEAFKKFVAAMSVKQEEVDERKAIRFIRVIKRRSEEQITLKQNRIKELKEEILNSKEFVIDLITEKEEETYTIPASSNYEDWIKTLKSFDNAVSAEKAKKIILEAEISKCISDINFFMETIKKFTN